MKKQNKMLFFCCGGKNEVTMNLERFAEGSTDCPPNDKGGG